MKPSTGTARRGRVRTPTLLQMEAVECGAAALGIVLAWHGRVVPLAELREECGVSRDGSNAASMVKAARRYGLESHGYSLELDELRALDPPFVAFWGFDHFVVIEGFGREQVFLNDPACGHRRVDLDELDRCFTGVVLTFSPGPEFRRGGRRPSVLRALRERLGGARDGLGAAVLAGLLLVLPGLALPAFTQVFIDEVLIEQRAGWLRPIVLAMAVVAAVLGLLRWLQLGVLRRLRTILAASMNARLAWHLLRLPVTFYAQRFAGEIGSRSALNDKIAGVLSGQLAQTAIDVLMMGFYAALMLYYDVGLTLLGVSFAALDFAALTWISQRRKEENLRVLQEYGKLSGVCVAGIQAIESVKASGLESTQFSRWSGHFASAANARQALALADVGLGSLPALLGALAHAAVLGLGGLRVIEGGMTIGMLAAFQVLMASFLRPVDNLVRLGRTWQELSGDLMRLDDVLAHPSDPELGPTQSGPAPAPTGRLRGHLELEHVRFGYNPGEPPLLEGFDLVLEPGRRTALVGGSGSGKTTVARLVCGLLQPWSGRILLDGVPRERVPRGTLAVSLALVDQDVLLFAGSVRDNLTLWDPTLPDGELLEALADAQLVERVLSLPGGLDAELSEGGTNLSGGERQRLEIARALAGRPSILVLDEATSALDAQTERRIVERIARRGATCLIVAHRLSTVRDCDEIVVLEGGRIVERGTHEELWRRRGAYARLVQAHADGVVEVGP